MSENESLKTKIRRSLRLDLALRFVWQSTPGWTVANIALVVIQGPLPLLSLYLMKLMIDEVTKGLAAGGSSSSFHGVLWVVIWMAVVSLLGTLIGMIAGLVNQAQSLVVTDYMQNIIHAKSIEVDLEYYENPEYYNTLRRAQQEAPYRPLHILQGLTQLGQSALSLTAIGALLLSLHPILAGVLLIAVVPGFLVRLRYSGKMYRWQRERTATDRQVWYYSWMLTGDSYAKEVRLFNLGALFMKRYRDLRRKLRGEQLRLTTQQALAGLLAQIGSSVAIYGAYAFIAYRTIHGDISLGALVMYYQAFQRGQGYLQSILGSLAGLYEDNLFLSNLYEFLSLKPKIASPAHPQPIPRPIRNEIVFEHVGFKYPTGTRIALEDINLTIRPGQKIALVGQNGSGKTTLIKLLCRLYDPTEGRITVDGIDLREFDVTGLRREIGVILQDYAHYNLTAQENIWLGNVEIAPDRERIVNVAQSSGADEVISGLKKNYDTVLGKWFQDGEELSIGEWQKVALARAFLRDAQIIILDEPTSAMDAKAEFEIFTKLHELTTGRTAVTISHRFSTVRMADCIYVLDHGRIIESGTHEELLRLGGKYAALFEMQAQHYK
jgi:ATP-binding cassette subfamily B protein